MLCSVFSVTTSAGFASSIFSAGVSTFSIGGSPSLGSSILVTGIIGSGELISGSFFSSKSSISGDISRKSGSSGTKSKAALFSAIDEINFLHLTWSGWF